MAKPWPLSWPGQAQYTIWCDDRGFVLEDGVILRLGGRYEVPGTFVRVETGGAWYSLTYR